MKIIQRISLIFLSLMIFSIFTYGQVKKSGGVVITKDREVLPFTGIIANGTYHLYIKQGPVCALRVEADENVHEYIKTIVDGDNLRIDILDDIKKAKTLNVYVVVKNLKTLVILGSVIAHSDSVITVEKLNLFLGGTTNSTFNFMAEQMEIEIGDGAIAKLSGSVEILKVRAADDVDIDAFALKTGKCKLIATGFPEVKLNISNEFDLTVTGGGNVYYLGEPTITNRIFSGSGFIVKRRSEKEGGANNNQKNKGKGKEKNKQQDQESDPEDE